MNSIPVRCLLILALAGFGFNLQAADLAGSQDYPGIKRFQGSDIIGYKTIPYDSYRVALGNGSPSDPQFEKSQSVEGKITRIVYRVPVGHTVLELLRNYEQELTGDGYTQVFELPPDQVQWGDRFATRFYFQGNPGGIDGDRNPFVNLKLLAYLTGKMSKPTGDVYVAVCIVQSTGHSWNDNFDKSIPVAENEIVVGLDVIETKPVANQMVVVKAAEIEQTLKDAGHIALYGIYFDTDKTEIKPESADSLAQIAQALKDQPDLKLTVSGHTDNTGSSDHNDALSLGRATAVVNALVSQYGISADRLQAKGFGSSQPVASNETEEGRAKNRRVELVKQ